MKIAILHSSELFETRILKPNFHLNFGKRRMRIMIEKGKTALPLHLLVHSVYFCGIFKRIFVNSKEHGVPYITAQQMMTTNPLLISKLLSKRYTFRQAQMTLKDHQILVSCAGTVGNVRLITTDLDGIIGSQDIIRVDPKEDNYGFIYAFLASRTCYEYIQSLIYGSVVPRIEPNALANIPVPNFAKEKQQQIHDLIAEASNLRIAAIRLLNEAEQILYISANLNELQSSDYNYFGPRSNRKLSCFTKNIKDIDTTSINAFNHSDRIENTIQRIKKNNNTLTLNEVLNEKKLFSTGSFPRIEVKSDRSIMLINQSDIFDTIICGKRISRQRVNTDNLAQYGEVLIAGVGTLGESESFCRVNFVNEDIQNQLISGEFIRMRTNEKIPAGYLFAWLNTDYGFRLIRSTQTGTKLCRPIQRLLLNLPIPIIKSEVMTEIHDMVINAFTLRFQANQKENQAIELVEKEIEQWQQ